MGHMLDDDSAGSYKYLPVLDFDTGSKRSQEFQIEYPTVNDIFLCALAWASVRMPST